ncbi:hypothetical protein MCUN1_001805 [Malassezia cuniculi]|uniref:Protein FAF1 n=1 Tax=Malassezia cuniculi TaxID=948313 RepID=A0AAF0ETQ4_9BASI|nr:hypothetical protein MCUN1_001805 [Malassezia cuniculi]
MQRNKAKAAKKSSTAAADADTNSAADAADKLKALEALFYQQFDMPGGAPQHNGELRNESADEMDSDSDENMRGDANSDAEESDFGEVGSGDDSNDDDAAGDATDDATADAAYGSDKYSGARNSHKGKGASAVQRRVPETVVFDGGRPSTFVTTKAQRKQFMSSKTQDLSRDLPEPEPEEGESESDEESQRVNDKKLEHLLSTTLFAPGADNTRKRKLTTTSNETLARVLELSSDSAKTQGWGAKQLKATELGRMPASIRQGLRRAAGERRAREIETQKELGLWQPPKGKKQNRATATEMGMRPTQPKKRIRGIGSGIGKFRGGVLHLSDADVQRIKKKK